MSLIEPLFYIAVFLAGLFSLLMLVVAVLVLAKTESDPDDAWKTDEGSPAANVLAQLFKLGLTVAVAFWLDDLFFDDSLRTETGSSADQPASSFLSLITTTALTLGVLVIYGVKSFLSVKFLISAWKALDQTQVWSCYHDYFFDSKKELSEDFATSHPLIAEVRRQILRFDRFYQILVWAILLTALTYIISDYAKI